MIYDCFTYAGEDDMLYLRLQTLKDVVDRFVIAEGTRTFAGKPRTPLFDPARFADFASRIEYVLVDDLEANPASAWENEWKQRNALARGLRGAAPGDWVLLSDVDEIPRPASLAAYRPAWYLSAVLHQGMYYYAFNNRMVRSRDPLDVPWRMVRLTTVAHLQRFYGTLQNLRAFRARGPWRRFIRQWQLWRTQVLPDAGWHFSYLMTPQQIRQKIESFSHQELNRPEFTDEANIRRRLLERQDLFDMGREFEVVPLDDSFPQPLLAERERFAPFIF